MTRIGFDGRIIVLLHERERERQSANESECGRERERDSKSKHESDSDRQRAISRRVMIRLQTLERKHQR